MSALIPCPSCNQQLAIEERFFGLTIRCPACSKEIQIPDPRTKPASSSPVPPTLPPPSPPPPPQESSQQPLPKLPRSSIIRAGSPPPPPGTPPTHRRSVIDEVTEEGRDDLGPRMPHDPNLPNVRRPHDEYFDDEPHALQRPTGKRASWKRVHLGVTQSLAGVLILILTMIVVLLAYALVVGYIASSMQPGRSSRMTLPMFLGIILVIIGIYALGWLAAMGFTIAGSIFSTYSPKKNGARILAWISFVSILTYFVSFVSSQIIAFVYASSSATARTAMPITAALTAQGVEFFLMIIAICGVFVYMICYQLYLRAVAATLNRDGLVLSITLMLATQVFCFATCLGVFFVFLGGAAAFGATGGNSTMSRNVADTAGAAGIIGVCGSGVLNFAWSIWYIVSLNQVRAAVQHRIETKARV